MVEQSHTIHLLEGGLCGPPSKRHHWACFAVLCALAVLFAPSTLAGTLVDRASKDVAGRRATYAPRVADVETRAVKAFLCKDAQQMTVELPRTSPASEKVPEQVKKCYS